MIKIYQIIKSSLIQLYNMLKKMPYKEMLMLNYHQLIKKVFSMDIFLLENKEQMLDKHYQNLVQLLHLIQLQIVIIIVLYFKMQKLKQNLKEKDYGILKDQIYLLLKVMMISVKNLNLKCLKEKYKYINIIKLKKLTLVEIGDSNTLYF